MNQLGTSVVHTPMRTRSYLLILILLIVIPFTILLAYEIMLYTSSQVERSRSETLRLAQLSSTYYAQDFRYLEEELRTMVANRDIRASVNGVCTPMLRGLPRILPSFEELLIYTPDARLVCAANVPPLMLPDADWVRAALDQPRMSIGRPPAAEPDAAFFIAMPIMDPQPIGLLVVAVMHDRLQQPLDAIALPDGATITLLTPDGTFAARSLNPEQFVGESARGFEIADMALAGRRGTLEALGNDGMRRIWGIAPVDETGWIVYAGFPTDLAYAEINQIAVRQIASIVLVLCIAGIASGWIVARFIRSTGHLARVAQAVAAGDLSQRATVQGPHELTQVAEQFNTMLDIRIAAETSLRRARDTLEQRVVERTAALERELEQHRRTEQALRRSEQTRRTILRNLPDMIISINYQNIVTEFVPAASIPVPFNRIIGRPLEEILGAADLQPVLQAIARARTSGQPQIQETVIRSDDAEYVVEIRILPPIDIGMLLIIRNITERFIADRLKHEFVSVVSHELRTPLTSIRGALGLVLGGVAGPLTPQAQNMITIAHSNSERLVRLINDILDIEKIESGQLMFSNRLVSIGSVAERAITDIQAYAVNLGVEIRLEAPVPDVDILADPDRLIQVLTNLLSNAAKFSPHGTTVAVVISTDGQHVRVNVVDHGSGIPEAFRERIFQKFAQADSSSTRAKGGTGLGLSISKAIIERLGGQIGYHPGSDGTTFWFELPIQPRAIPPTTPNRSRILICEDDRDIAELLRLMLEQAGFAVDVVHTATAVIEQLEQQPYDGLTLDLMLPGKSGIELIHELRANDAFRSLPIVVISARAEQARGTIDGKAIGIADWLPKPIDRERLIAALDHAIQSQTAELPCVLHIEDDPDIAAVVRSLLADVAELVHVDTIAAARQILATRAFDLALLDTILPDGSGIELLPLLANQQPSIPVVIFSAIDNIHLSQDVAAHLVKTRTSNEDLLTTIISLLARG
ncbi:MAG TPA: response regulator [Roseiflexaceae bacterium]|nr:response regulator [Roseiflexaceae bacterium]